MNWRPRMILGIREQGGRPWTSRPESVSPEGGPSPRGLKETDGPEVLGWRVGRAESRGHIHAQCIEQRTGSGNGQRARFLQETMLEPSCSGKVAPKAGPWKEGPQSQGYFLSECASSALSPPCRCWKMLGDGTEVGLGPGAPRGLWKSWDQPGTFLLKTEKSKTREGSWPWPRMIGWQGRHDLAGSRSRRPVPAPLQAAILAHGAITTQHTAARLQGGLNGTLPPCSPLIYEMGAGPRVPSGFDPRCRGF